MLAIWLVWLPHKHSSCIVTTVQAAKTITCMHTAPVLNISSFMQLLVPAFMIIEFV